MVLDVYIIYVYVRFNIYIPVYISSNYFEERAMFMMGSTSRSIHYGIQVIDNITMFS